MYFAPLFATFSHLIISVNESKEGKTHASLRPFQSDPVLLLDIGTPAVYFLLSTCFCSACFLEQIRRIFEMLMLFVHDI